VTAKKSTARTERIVGLFPELLGVGGVQEAGRETAVALEEIAGRRGWATCFLSLNDPAGIRQFTANSRRISLRGFGRSKPRFVFSALRAAFHDAGVVVASHPHLAVPAAWMRTMATRLRVIVMSHGVEVWEQLPSRRHRALLRADLVLAPSRDTAQKLAQIQGVPAEKIRRLAWPLSPDFLGLAADPSRLPRLADFPQGRVILTVGRWAAAEGYKGVDQLIRAFSELRPSIPDLRLAAVGEGDDLRRLQKLAADLGVADEVHFFSGLSRAEIAACYSRAEIFALPSAGEGYGLVFLEAMAFAKPLVGAAYGGVTDLIEDGVNGLLVPPRDATPLRRALERLLKDRAFAGELGRRGAERVRRLHRFEDFASALEEILEQCGLDSPVAG